MKKELFIEKVKGTSIENANQVLERTHSILDTLTDERVKKYVAPYGALDTIILVEEIGELIAALLSGDRVSVMEEAADTMLCIMSMEYIYSIDSLPLLNTQHVESVINTRKEDINDLLVAQQVICKSIRGGRADHNDLLKVHNNLVNIITKYVPVEGLKRAMAVKLSRIEERLKSSELN